MLRYLGTALCAGALALAAALPIRADVKEAETGVKFAETLAAGGKTLDITGAGVREKGWIDVYAAALYIDSAAAKGKLSPYKGKSASSLASGSFYNDFIYTDMTKALVLHLVRDVDADTMREALSDGLKPHMTYDSKAKDFVGRLKNECKDGKRLTFVWLPGWKVQMIQDGKTLGAPVQSKPLCAALAKIWFGSDPISDNIKTRACDRIPNLLK